MSHQGARRNRGRDAGDLIVSHAQQHEIIFAERNASIVASQGAEHIVSNTSERG